MPLHTAANPTIKLKVTLRNARRYPRSSMSFAVSYSNVEKVVYAPTKPTAIASRRCGLMFIRSVASVRKNPRMNEPVTLMTKVAVGNGAATRDRKELPK